MECVEFLKWGAAWCGPLLGLRWDVTAGQSLDWCSCCGLHLSSFESPNHVEIFFAFPFKASPEKENFRKLTRGSKNRKQKFPPNPEPP